MLCFLLPGCASQQFASATLEKLNNVTIKREDSQLKAIEDSVTTSFQVARKYLEARIDQRRAETISQIHARISTKLNELVKAKLGAVENNFKPEVERMEGELNKAKQEAMVSGDRENEYRIALQLSATLTAHARESFELEHYIRDKFDKLEKDNVSLANDKFNDIKNELPDVISEVKAVMDDINKKSVEYKTAVTSGFKEVDRYILRWQKAGETLKSILIPDFGSLVTDKVSTQVNNFQTRIENSLSKEFNEIITKFESDLGKTVTTATVNSGS